MDIGRRYRGAIKPRTGSARRSAMTASPGSHPILQDRLNFLDLLRAGHPDYVLNEAAFAYLRDRGLSAALIARLAEAGQTHFADQTAWQAYLDGLGIVSPAEPGVAASNPVQIATEGALWGSIHAHGLLREAVLLSDDAAVRRRAPCLVLGACRTAGA